MHLGAAISAAFLRFEPSTAYGGGSFALVRMRAARAKTNGVKLGRTPKLTPHQRREAIKRRDAGVSIGAHICTPNHTHVAQKHQRPKAAAGPRYFSTRAMPRKETAFGAQFRRSNFR
jgi:hypothetical protein